MVQKIKRGRFLRNST